MSVDPSTFRNYTPQPTGASDGLWQSVAQGEVAAAYELDKAQKLPLGQRVPLGSTKDVRIGALAEFQIPDVDAVVNLSRGAQAGLRTPAVIVSAPNGTESSLKRDLSKAFGGQVAIKMLRPTFTLPSVPGGPTKSYAPGTLLELYQRGAATCPGLPWQVLAAIGQVETNHGQNKAVSSAGAMGPMQFMPETFKTYGVDGDGDGVANILDQADAVYSAARYLCAAGGGQPDTLYQAIYAYNHADWYVREVLSIAADYKAKY
jgi:hypothetical protein